MGNSGSDLGGSHSANHRSANDNHANNCNPNHKNYKGYSKGYKGTGSNADLNNHGD